MADANAYSSDINTISRYTQIAAGNTWNDWMDRDIDSKVARTKDRPLASGKISPGEAFTWMVFLYSTSVGILKAMLGDRDV